MRAVLLLTLVLAGCVAPPPEPGAAPAEALAFALGEAVRVTGPRAVEPALAVAPDGALYVAGYEYYFVALQPASLWRSGDAGATWTPVNPGGPAQGAVGNSDVDLVVAPDGTLYLASMQWLSVGVSISVGASADEGASWVWRTVAVDAWADRPFLAVSPDGVAHVVWSNARGLHHASSADRGRTWTEGPLVHASGGAGRIAAAPDGALAARVMPLSGPTIVPLSGVEVGLFVGNDPAADGIAVSTDSGASWTFRTIPGNRTPFDRVGRGGDGTFRWAEPVAFDASGTLHTAWTEAGRLHLARSRDLGVTWDARAVADDAPARAIFPNLVVGAGGLLAGWYVEDGEALRAHVARIEWPADGEPSMARASFEPATSGSPGGEYFAVGYLPDGRAAAATLLADGSETGFEFRAEARAP